MSDLLKRLTEIGQARVEEVKIGEDVFYVRGMTSHQRAVFVMAMQQAALENSTVPDHTVVALGLCNEDGTPTGQLAEVVDILAPLDGQVLFKLATKILQLSGFARGAVEAAEKN